MKYTPELPKYKRSFHLLPASLRKLKIGTVLVSLPRLSLGLPGSSHRAVKGWRHLDLELVGVQVAFCAGIQLRLNGV